MKFTNGTPLIASNSESQADSLLPNLVVASKLLVAFVDSLIFVDPSAGDITLTLPTPIVTGQVFRIIRITNGGFKVLVNGASINNFPNGVYMGFKNQVLDIVGDLASGTYRATSPLPGQLAVLKRTSASNFAVTTSFVKYDQWETKEIETLDSLLASTTTDDINVNNFEGEDLIFYKCNFSLNFEGLANRICCARLVFDGTIGGDTVLDENATTSQGPGRPSSLSINGDFKVTETGKFRIDLQAEGNDTWGVARGRFEIAKGVL